LPAALRSGMRAITGSRRARGIFAALATPLGAWLLHVVVLWGWHVPAAFDAAVANEFVHWLQHLSFFLAAAIFWHSVIAPGHAPQRSAPGVISLFTTAMHTSVLGVLLTFSGSVWYAPYAAGVGGLGALEDQQLGGLIMWVPGGIVFAGAALAIVGVLLIPPDL